ncbi:MAG: helix-turn-helix domain-containing protein, partial [Dehalococcoidia bacterium]
MLRALREARGVTLDGWAARIGVSRSTVQRWERSERVPDPGAEATLIAYCREAGLFRTYDRGPLAGLNLTAEMLQDLLAEARWDGNRQPVPSVASPHGRSLSAAEGSAGGIEQSAELVATQHAAPLRSAQGGPSTQHSNLPLPLTSFVGRQQELAAIRRVQAGTRLLTLTGAGGVGKTRLALALAQELFWAYPHGVCFIELAPLADSALVPATVAAALDLWTSDQQPVTERLVEHLRARQLLLILDNCEHLLDACAALTEALLRACPSLE